MSRVEMVNGIGFSQYSGAMYMDMAAINGATSPIQSDPPAKPFQQTVKNEIVQSTPWAIWGDDNLLPNTLADYLDTCGILNAIVDGKSRFALCEGLVPARVIRNKSGQIEVVDIVNDPEINDFLDANNHYYHCFSWMKDICGFRNGVARYMLDKERKKIAAFQRDDITEMRYELMDKKTGKIDKIYLSASWDRVGKYLTGDNEEYVKKITLLDKNNPVQDLTNKVDGGSDIEFAVTFMYPGWRKKYYATPLWYAALEWVKIAQKVPKWKDAMFNNSIRPRYMVLIHKDFWQKYLLAGGKNLDSYSAKEIEEKKSRFYDDIDEHLTGTENAFKAIFTEFNYTQDGKMMQDIEIKVIDDKLPQGEYLPESAVANSEIAFSELFNPSILGSNLPSGPYTNSQGGSNVRESILMQVILHEFERKMIQRFMSIPKYFNGWNKKHQKSDAFFEFIIPATIPTTLDTGGSTKPMIQQNPDNNKPAANGTD